MQAPPAFRGEGGESKKGIDAWRREGEKRSGADRNHLGGITNFPRDKKGVGEKASLQHRKGEERKYMRERCFTERKEGVNLNLRNRRKNSVLAPQGEEKGEKFTPNRGKGSFKQNQLDTGERQK